MTDLNKYNDHYTENVQKFTRYAQVQSVVGALDNVSVVELLVKALAKILHIPADGRIGISVWEIVEGVEAQMELKNAQIHMLKQQVADLKADQCK